MSDLSNLQHPEMFETRCDHTIEPNQQSSQLRAENVAAAQPPVAETGTQPQEIGHISPSFGDVVNPNAPRVLGQERAKPPSKAFIFGSPITGNKIAEAGLHNASTWNAAQDVLAA